MTAPAIALMILTILLVSGGLVASVVLLQVLSVPTDEETEAAQRAIEDVEAAKQKGGIVKLVAFDLDDTLAPSKSPLPARMDVALRSLLDHVEVCIISGGQMGQFRTQVLDNLHATDEQLSRLHLMPTCGTRYYRYEGGAWVERYAHDLDPEIAARAIASLERHARDLGLWESNPWGNIIEDRGSQITFSALGQEAPLDAKRAWDPDGTKKAALRDAVQPDVPELDVRGGGSTSVDITTRGIDKAFGMGKLVEETGIPASEMLFIGDRLDSEGNDYPVKAAGYATRAVSGWEECVDVIDEIVASMS